MVIIWNEVSRDGKLVLQIQQSIAFKQFKKWLDGKPKDTAEFYIASELNDIDFDKFTDIFYDKKTGKFKKAV